VRIWDFVSKEEKHEFSGFHRDVIETLAWSQDGKYLASGGQDMLIFLYDPVTGRMLKRLTERIPKPFVHKEGFEFAVGLKSVSHEDWVLSLDWSPDSRYLLSGSWDETVGVWDMQQGKQTLQIKNEGGWVRGSCLVTPGQRGSGGWSGR